MKHIFRWFLVGVALIILTACSTADTTPPVITLNGDTNMTLKVGDTYTEPGAVAIDDRDGKVAVKISGSVDTSKEGTYIVTYSAKDKAGNKAVAQRTVVVNKKSQLIEDIARVEEKLNDGSIPYTTEEDFNKSKYVESNLTIDDIRESNRAHMLVAIAKDPEPEWFSTVMEPEVIFAEAGKTYTVNVKKARKDGSIIGSVDNDKLNIVVRVQRGKSDFEYITNVQIDRYAKWEGEGKLKITVPADLQNGRLLVAVRPNFVDVPTKAIAERWSALMSAEVWTKKDNVVTISGKNVLFPLSSAPYIDPQSKFTKSDIKSAVDTQRANNTITLPLIVKDIDLNKNDLVSYLFEGKPYAGRVIVKETKENQTLVLLAPEYTKVFNITDINDTSAKDQGLVPKHVIYRIGGQIETDQNETDPVEFKRENSIGPRRSATDLFDLTCSRGEGMLTFEPKFTLYPFDVGVDFSFRAISTEVTCKLEAKPFRATYHPPLAAGGVFGVIGKLLGSGFSASSFGEEYITADALPSAGAKMGWSYRNGASFNLTSPVGALKLGSRDLDEIPSQGTLKAGAKLGMKYELNAISEDGWLADIYSRFSDKVDFDDIGIEASVGPDVAYVVTASNAKSVKEGQGSEVGVEFGVKAEVSFSQTADSLIKSLTGINSLVKINETYQLLDLKYMLEFNYNSVSDDGQGRAHLVGLRPKYGFIASMLPDAKGVLSLDDSSVYNDKSEAIEYSLDECAQNPDFKIVSPAIGCAGWMCGNVNKDVVLCKGKLSISDTIASARVRELASTKSTIVNNAGDIKVSISGSPLTPKTKTLEMKAGTKADVVFEKVCPGQPGVFRGKSTVTAEGVNLSAESLNILTCYKDENKGDPHITTSDGLGYDYFASGDYILSRILDADGNPISGYEIQGRFLPGFKTSWPQAVALNVGGDRVEIQGIETDGHGNGSGVKINALSIWINGEKYFDKGGYSSYQSNSNLEQKIIKLPSGGIIAITETKSSLVLTFPTSMTIIWPEGSPAENYGLVVNVADAPNPPFIETLIARPDDFAGQERGLLGNNDGDPKNDFIRRNGEVLGVDHNLSFTELYALFGTDWLVRPYESLFRNPEAIKPQFPADVVTLTPEQRALGEEACRALTGFYREACIMDVGLTGSAEIVKEYYADTEDLNELSDAIVVPDVDRARYSMSVGGKSYAPDSGYYLHYTQTVDITHISGEGSFMLLVRPPRGATAMLGSGYGSYTGEGNYSTVLEVDCTQQNSATDSEYLQKEGALQLWLQDPLSGTASYLVSQEPLVCTDASKRAGFRLSFGVREEKADSNNTHLHYTQPLSVIHTNSYEGEYILELTPPSNGAVLTLNGSTTELNVTGSGDYNATIELDCTQVNYDDNYANGSINLWEKDKLSGQKAYLYGSVSLSCKKSKVLKTGQTVSYADFDDGYYQKGEERSYSRDDANDIVIDHVTGLMWQDDADAASVTKPWVTQANYDAGNYNDTSGDTAATYCANLTLGGYNDWRLPTDKELESLVDYGKVHPSIDTAYFQNASSYGYWSSTTDAGSSYLAWVVSFNDGYVYNLSKFGIRYVRCVRAGE